MNLSEITPLILTFNEAPNIGSTLSKLQWAKDVVIVDSFSHDNTLEILSRFPQVRTFQRRFDSHAAQWNYALRETGINTEWVLALDADYVLTGEFVEELKSLDPDASIAGYRAGFTYCISGRRLRGAVYPPVTVLYRRKGACYMQDGHTQRLAVNGNGRVVGLKTPILHEDRKPFSDWLLSQNRYMRLEAEKLSQLSWAELGWADRMRKMVVVFPFVAFFYCLVVKGALLDGRAGLYYAFQRMTAECILSACILERGLISENSRSNGEGD